MRLDAQKVFPDAVKAVYSLSQFSQQTSTVERKLLHLIEMRVSQINGCAFCLALHGRALREDNEDPMRIDCLPTWRESGLFTERERAGLAWAESITLVADTGVPDEVWEEVSHNFNEREICDLTLAIAVINTWNRLNVPFRTDPKGSVAIPSASVR